jgi:hypothetical protein
MPWRVAEAGIRQEIRLTFPRRRWGSGRGVGTGGQVPRHGAAATAAAADEKLPGAGLLGREIEREKSDDVRGAAFYFVFRRVLQGTMG